ncbi:MAG: RNA-binding cell elongation regulator Jag/EloR [Ardenticatenaceae bacterium]|nr:RNA-binding cell elongation regulator Jag/EloR [Ardenticatenaceae bacterium]
MSAKGKAIEISADSVDEAIQKGLLVLGVTRSEIEYEIVDEGRSGFLGIGNRLANIRIWVKGGQGDNSEVVETAVVEKEEEAVPEPPAAEITPEAGVEVEPAVPAAVEDMEFDDLENLPDPYLLEEEEVAVEVLTTLFDKMQLDVEIKSQLGEADELGKQAVTIDIRGEDLDPLVGSRGEGVIDLQFLARLMVGQQLRRRVSFMVDVNGYRHRKEEGLEKLALRMADKVTKRQKPITLEPMNSYERRLIHMSLRDQAKVYTRSVGEGASRRVRIYPASEKN